MAGRERADLLARQDSRFALLRERADEPNPLHQAPGEGVRNIPAPGDEKGVKGCAVVTQRSCGFPDQETGRIDCPAGEREGKASTRRAGTHHPTPETSRTLQHSTPQPPGLFELQGLVELVWGMSHHSGPSPGFCLEPGGGLQREAWPPA